jgi:hypothetical protein
MLSEKELFPELYGDEFWGAGMELEDEDGNAVWVPWAEVPHTPTKLIPSVVGRGGGRFVPDYDQIPD